MYVVIGGCGKIGTTVAKLLLGAGHEVAIIEGNVERATRLGTSLPGRSLVIAGNCCDEASLRDAGCEYADAVCALTGQDDTNLSMCEIACTLFNVPRCVARVNDARNERIFTKLGFGVVSSTTLIARSVEKEVLAGGSRTVMALKNGEFSLIEVEIPNSASLRSSGGQRVGEIGLPPSTVLVAVSNGDSFDTVNGRTVLHPGDTVLVCVGSRYEADARRALLNL